MEQFDSSDDENIDFDTGRFEIDWVDFQGHGFGDDTILAISALPGCRFKDTWRDINKDMSVIQENGIKDVFVLVTKGEMGKYRARDLLKRYKDLDIKVHHHPILDGQASTSSNLLTIVNDLKTVLKEDRKTLIHCFGGLGRSCLVVAALLMCSDESLSADQAIAKMRQLRGKGAVQSVKQYNMLHELREQLAATESSEASPENGPKSTNGESCTKPIVLNGSGETQVNREHMINGDPPSINAAT